MVKEIPAQEARQGNKSPRMLIVLIASLVVAALVWGVVEIYYQNALAPKPITTEAAQPQTDKSPDHPVNNQ